ncbi:MAG TPA: hypothetical protein VGJ18_20150 [Gemmatimonadaceae bacterium]
MSGPKSAEPTRYDRRATQPRLDTDAPRRDTSAPVTPPDEPSETRESTDYTSITTIALGVYLVLVLFLLVDMTVRFWPTTAPTPTAAAPSSVSFLFGLITLQAISSDVRLILLAMVFGALGSCIHVAQSFATFAGNRTLRSSWAWWYVLRPFIGAALAAVVYVALRGALFPATAALSGDMSPFGVAAIAGLTGMFSKQAVDKLNEVFSTAFATKDSAESTGDIARKDKALTSLATTERRRVGPSAATSNNGGERGDVPDSNSALAGTTRADEAVG